MEIKRYLIACLIGFMITQLLISVDFTSQAHESNSCEYVYPIAQLDEDVLLIMHQKSCDDIEILAWNRHNKTACKELASIFLPSQVKLLPGKQAFSFIDRGRIRIKSFQKRAPRVIDIYESIHFISSLQWLNDEQCYFVGKDGDKFTMFLCDISDRNTSLYRLNSIDAYDYLYPCKVDKSIFCLVRNDDIGYALCKLPWAPRPYEEKSENFNKEILLTHENPLCFLQMQDDTHGFVLEYTKQAIQQEFFHVSCLEINYDDQQNIWKMSKLFDFKLPLKLLMGHEPQRVYESINPFLPYYDKDFIYFVSYDEDFQRCNIWRYNRNSQDIESIMHPSKSNKCNHIFAPLMIEGALYFGFSFDLDIGRNDVNSGFYVNDATGEITCSLPEKNFLNSD